MNITELLAGLSVTGVVSVAAARWLAQRLIDHRLKKGLSDYEAELNRRLAEHKADLDQSVNAADAANQARLKKEIEVYLAERSAELTYREEARRRLYNAVGPLRFQLLIAAAECASRIDRIGGEEQYDSSLRSYFGQSTIYRLLRVLATAELIERQVAFADFAVDPSMRMLLRFKRLMNYALSSDGVSRGHPDENWHDQEQHVFSDVIAIVCASMIVRDSESVPPRVMRFDEFSNAILQGDGKVRFQPLTLLLNNFEPESKPILWLRLLAIGHLCVSLLELQDVMLGIEPTKFRTDNLLRRAKDGHISANLQKYLRVMDFFSSALRTRDC